MMEKKLPNHKYRFIQEKSIDQLPRDHRRLQVFYFKGTKCVTCGIECNRLIQGRDNGGGAHWDLYDEALTTMLTVGHIIPACRGGRNELHNLRPLCHRCNTKEGKEFHHLLKDSKLFQEHCKGKKVKRQSGNNFQDGQYIATIDSIFISDKIIYFGFVGDFTYPANKTIFI
jgi:5-methylcytosine-specific restriction endonuclease McrA